MRRAATGGEALDQVAAERPDLVVLDVMLPGMSGWEVCKALRAQYGQLPVIMVTARGEEVDRVVGLELGADDYVVKPFHGRELVARVPAASTPKGFICCLFAWPGRDTCGAGK